MCWGGSRGSARPFLSVPVSQCHGALLFLCSSQVNIDELIRVLKIASIEHKKLHGSPLPLVAASSSAIPAAAPVAASSAPPAVPSTAPAGPPESHAHHEAASAPPNSQLQ